MYLQMRAAAVLAAGLFVAGSAAGALIEGQFLPEQPPVFGVGANGNNGTLTIGTNQYPLPAELNPVAATTIRLSPGQQLVVSHRTPEITDTCSGSAVQHMYHRVPASPGDPLPLIRTVCLDEPRAFEGFYEQPGASTQQVAALREQTPLTTFDQRISFVRLDVTPGVIASQLYEEDVESVQFSPSGTVALIKYDLPGGNIDPADYRFIDLCPDSFGNQLANFPDVGAGTQATVESDGNSGFQVRFSHPSFNGGSTTFPIVDCLGSPPPPPDGEQPLRVTLAGNGSGRVFSSPTGINCPSGACQSNFPEDAAVTLNAAPDPGSTFAGWAGDCSGTLTSVSVTLDAPRECQATFTRPAAELGLTCSGSATVVAGDRWPLQFNISNAGPDALSSAEFAIPAVAGLTLVPNESSSGCFGFADGSVACNIRQLPASENVQLNLVFDVDPFARGSVAVDASVQGTPSDPIGGNDQCQVAATLDVEVDLSLSKTGNPDPVAAGDLLVYSLDVTNSGRSGALNVATTDNLPPEVQPISGAGVCTIGNVSPGAQVTATVITRVAESLANGTLISNTATVSTSDPDLNLADNMDSASVTVGPASAPPARRFSQIDREFENGRTDLSLPSQSGANTAYFANTGNGNPGVYVNVAGEATVEAYGGRQSIPGRGGSYVNTGLSMAPTVDNLATAWFGQYAGGGGTLNSLVSLADGCVAEGLFDESLQGASGNSLFSSVSDVQLRGGRLAFSANLGGVVGIREANGTFDLFVVPGTALPASNGPLEFYSVGGLAFDGVDIAFTVAAGCGQDFSDCDYQGIFIYNGSGFVRVADSNTAIPGGNGSFQGFSYVDNSLSMHNGQLAFHGYDSQLRAGIYLYDGGNLTELVGPNTPIPGSTATFDTAGVGNFSGQVLSLSAPALHNGTVAFVGGNFSAGIEGLWLIRRGSIEEIVRIGDEINGDRVDRLGVGRESLGADRLAFRATVAIEFTGGANDAIFTTGVNTSVVFSDGFESL